MNALIPMDPADYDRLPPADVDACDHCGGEGVIPTTTDPQSGLPEDVPCPLCGGTGELTGPHHLGGAA